MKAILLLLLAVSAHAEVIDFTYTRAMTWTDGTPLALSDIRSTRLYCNSVMVDGHPGATGSFAPDLPDGNYTCYAVHSAFDSTGVVYESAHSNEVTRIVGTPVEITVGSPTNLDVQ